ncbi:Acetyltransferase (GNAT) family protein [Streptomyces sp. ADI96-02]|uniref:GNAT family N-acetyltransferase n=1 Tax=unclassified Streptomyces TaxID=2593676 RepID=UPI000F9CFF10|nr:GNAT family N-acetyltransferase [Streptomyces sp. ADI96-02]RPK54145.1 Acetyltransferase (GNAT) family protein [Streptomyces sp. ADI96-02]
MIVSQHSSPDPVEIFKLYESVDWQIDTRDMDKLCRALENSHIVITARDESGALLGLARTVSDDEVVCYVQDVAVKPEFHRQGVGCALVRWLVERYAHCRYFLLTTDPDTTPEGSRNHAFYRRMGLHPLADEGLTGFILPRDRTTR